MVTLRRGNRSLIVDILACIAFFCILWTSEAWANPSMSVAKYSSYKSHLYMGVRGKKIKKERKRALQEPTPPRIETAYGPIRFNRPPRTCDACRGRGVVRCNVCEGRGVVRATGPRKRNHLPAALPGSLWTSVRTREGHRHYKAIDVRGSKKKENLEVRMGNCCGEPISFWVFADELKNKDVWRKGWVTLDEIIQANGGALLDVAVCFRCKGERILKCIDCDGKGQIESHEPLYD